MRDAWMGRKFARGRGSSRSTASRGEFDFIKRLRRQELTRIPAHSSRITHHSSLLQGIGDDAAVFKQRGGLDTVITTDLLVEGIDFDLDTFKTSPRDVGHKALAVSLSDSAAMGARPRWALLSVGVPQRRWDSAFLDEFYKGVRALAELHDVTIIGGDISRTPEHVVCDSILLGELSRGRAVLRSGARSGDRIYGTGALGGAAAGLHTLQENSRANSAARLNRAQRLLVLRQTRPTPRVEWGRFLGERKMATAMIDLSDGLSSDLAHLCRESGVGATIEAARVPVDQSIKRAGVSASEALSLALHGGEDFELLFTVSPRKVAKLPDEVGGVPVTYIGDVTGDSGKIRIVENGRTRILKPSGFQHFNRTRR